MIKTVGPSSSPPFQGEPTQVMQSKQPSKPSDILVSDKKSKGQSDAWSKISHFFWQIWVWIKENFLCCFFDETEEQLDASLVSLRKFMDSCFTWDSEKPTVKAVDAVKKAFGKVPRSMQKRIEQYMFERSKEARKDKKDNWHRDRVKKILKLNPFTRITDKTKPVEEQKVWLLIEACFKLNEKLNKSKY